MIKKLVSDVVSFAVGTTVGVVTLVVETTALTIKKSYTVSKNKVLKAYNKIMKED